MAKHKASGPYRFFSDPVGILCSAGEEAGIKPKVYVYNSRRETVKGLSLAVINGCPGPHKIVQVSLVERIEDGEHANDKARS